MMDWGKKSLIGWCLMCLVSTGQAQHLSGVDREKTINKVTKLLCAKYVSRDIACQMSDSIRAQSERGAYDTIASTKEFASMLTSDMLKVYNDKHLAVLAKSDQSVNEVPDFSHFGIGEPKIEDGLGYLSIKTLRFHGRGAQNALNQALKRLQGASKIVLDLRGNVGGTVRAEINLISHFLPASTHYADVGSQQESKSTKLVTRRKKSLVRILEAPLYILVDNKTFSAAEAVAYHLQSFGRANIIGESTGGGAHSGRRFRVNKYFELALPISYPINLKTGANWEGKGVIPDMSVRDDLQLDQLLQ